MLNSNVTQTPQNNESLLQNNDNLLKHLKELNPNSKQFLDALKCLLDSTNNDKESQLAKQIFTVVLSQHIAQQLPQNKLQVGLISDLSFMVQSVQSLFGQASTQGQQS